MAYFAKLDDDSNVVAVISVNNFELIQDGVESEAKGIEFLVGWSGGYGNWKQTSFNGRIRKNFAGVGYKYDAQRDAFIPSQPFPSWTLNEETCLWAAPVAYPTDGQFYQWDEPTTSWMLINV